MAIKVKLQDKELKRQLAAATAVGLKRATAFYHRQCQKLVNKPNTGERVSRLAVLKAAMDQGVGQRKAGLVEVSGFNKKTGEAWTGKTWWRREDYANQHIKKLEKSTTTIYANPSKPGEPPRVRTGFGRTNIVWEFSEEELASRVGVTRNGLYMVYLDLGTRRIRPRPWLLIPLKTDREQIVRLMLSGRKG